MARRQSTTLIAIVAGALSVVPAMAAIVGPVTGVSAATGSVSGSVFRDYDQNGLKDTRELPQPNVWVKAYSRTAGADGMVGTTDDITTVGGPVRTDANGDWSITGISSDDLFVRVEFYGLDEDNDTTFDVSEQTLPTYLQPSAKGPANGGNVQYVALNATGVSYAVANPADYCQASASFAVTCFSTDTFDGAFASNSAVYTIPNDLSSATGTTPFSQVGATYGVAYRRSANQLFQSAFMKRHSGFGPAGIGGIYRNGATYVDLNTLPGFVGAGTDPHPTLSSANGGDWFHDPLSFNEVGRIGLGDLDISEDGATLLTVNLATSQLVTIPAASAPTSAAALNAAPSASQVGQFSIPSPCAGEQRPGALGVKDGLVYVGGVCSTSLTGYVYTFDLATRTWSSSPVLSFPFNETRGTNDDTSNENWQAWTSSLTIPSGTGRQEGGYNAYNPQPFFSDIEFDGRDLILGVRDRYGDQLGNNSGSTDTLEITSLAGVGVGEIYRACASGPTWTFESNASCGGVTTLGANTGVGPGGGEFYFEDGFSPTIGSQFNLAAGGLAQIPGQASVVMGLNDPNAAIYSGGLRSMSNSLGTQTTDLTVFSGLLPGSFGKANGMGDIEALCDQSPIEIGDYIWNDANGDGIQNESGGINSVTVELYDSTGTVLIGTTTTDASGAYRFTSAGGTASNTDNLVDSLLPNSTYVIRVDKTQTNLAGTRLSPAGATTVLDTSATNSDSNATMSGTDARITFSTGGPGANDYSLDIGFFRPFSLGNRVWLDADNNSIIGGSEVGLGSVPVELLDVAGNPIDGDPVQAGVQAVATTTDSNGYYRFDNLPQGKYRVRVTATGYLSSSNDSSSPDDDVDANTTTSFASDNGLGVAATATSGVVTLGFGTPEPTSEPDLGPGGQGTSVDSEANLTVDFGFHAPVVTTTTTQPTTTTTEAVTTTTEPVTTTTEPVTTTTEPVTTTTEPVTTTTEPVTTTTEPVTTTTEPVTTTIPAVTTTAPGATTTTEPVTTTTDPATTTTAPGVTTTSPGVTTTTEPVTTTIPAVTTTIPGPTTTVPAATTTVPAATTTVPAATTTVPAATTTIPAATTTVPAVTTTIPAATTTVPGATTTIPVDTTTTLPTVTTTTTTLPSRTYSIGDYVWIDLNRNGVQDSTEFGRSGVRVELLDAAGNVAVNASGNPVAPTTTDSAGRYRFVNLNAGSYQIRFLRPTGYGWTTTGGGTSASDSNAVFSTPFDTSATSGVVTILAGQVDDALTGLTEPTIDAGLWPTASLGDYVWVDDNKDGVQNEPVNLGLNGVNVRLLDGNGNLLASTATAAGPNGDPGYYAFVDLTPGVPYIVEFIKPGNYGFTTKGAGGTTDSDADVTTGRTAPVTLAAGQNNPTIDAGFVFTGTIVVATTTIPATATSTTLPGATTTTTAGGTTIPGGAVTSTSFSGSTTTTLPKGTICVGDRVWIDANLDGIQDVGEVGARGATIRLTLPDGTTRTTTTGENGIYQFCDLAPGTYLVTVTGGTVRADAKPTNGPSSRSVTLSVSNFDVDFGYGTADVLGEGATQDFGGDIAYSGSRTQLLSASAFLLVVAGGSLIVGSRRRRKS